MTREPMTRSAILSALADARRTGVEVRIHTAAVVVFGAVAALDDRELTFRVRGGGERITVRVGDVRHVVAVADLAAQRGAS